MSDFANRENIRDTSSDEVEHVEQYHKLANQLLAFGKSDNPFYAKVVGVCNFSPTNDSNEELIFEVLSPQGYYDKFRQLILDSAKLLSLLSDGKDSDQTIEDLDVSDSLAREYDRLRLCARTHFGIPALACPMAQRYPLLLSHFIELSKSLTVLALQPEISAEELGLLSEHYENIVSKLDGSTQATTPFTGTNQTVAGGNFR